MMLMTQARAWALAAASVAPLLGLDAHAQTAGAPTPLTHGAECAAMRAPALAHATPLADAAAARPQPQDASATVPRVLYHSPLAKVRSMAAAEVGDWRQANDLTYLRGGWKAYARAAQVPDAPVEPPPAQQGCADQGARP